MLHVWWSVARSLLSLERLAFDLVAALHALLCLHVLRTREAVRGRRVYDDSAVCMHARAWYGYPSSVNSASCLHAEYIDSNGHEVVCLGFCRQLSRQLWTAGQLTSKGTAAMTRNSENCAFDQVFSFYCGDPRWRRQYRRSTGGCRLHFALQ
jgi:hypothetical protein